MRSCSADLDARVRAYLDAHKVESPDRCDLVLALLRVGGSEALRRAEELAGVPIKRCPPAIPPWPPKPVSKQKRAPVVVRVARNPCLPTTGMFQRYRQIRVGMTVEQLIARGVTRRDLRLWSRAKHVEIR